MQEYLKWHNGFDSYYYFYIYETLCIHKQQFLKQRVVFALF